MTNTLTSNREPADFAIREPSPAEIERVLYLFNNVRLLPQARFLAAARSRPIERFVAAVAWWPEENIGRFHITCRPGVDSTAVVASMIDSMAERARLQGMTAIQCASLLAEGTEWFERLTSHGFKSLHSERSFEIAYENARARVMRLHQKYAGQIPSAWRVESIRTHSPETVINLIAAHRLMPPSEIRGYWKANSQFGFDLDLSCILFDGERPAGTFLARRSEEVCYIDVRVMRETNPRLRSLGNLFMMHQMFMAHHQAQLTATNGPIRWLRFRSGTAEHRETASLAFRMGGRELARGHHLSKIL